MKKMLNIPAFYQRVQELYARYEPVLTGMAGQVDGLRDEIGVSADLNYLRWNTLGTANPKPGGTPLPPPMTRHWTGCAPGSLAGQGRSRPRASPAAGVLLQHRPHGDVSDLFRPQQTAPAFRCVG